MDERRIFNLTLIICIILQLTVCSNQTKTEPDLKNNTKSKKNILCLMNVASPSHHIWNRVIMEALANKGYNVTALSVDVDAKPVPNLHYIHIEDVYKAIYVDEKFDLMEYSKLGIFESISDLMKFFSISNEAVLKSRGLKTLLNYPSDFKFDLVVYDFTSFPGILGVVQKFQFPPIVGVSAFMNPPNIYDVSGNPIFASLKPYYATSFTPDMNFFERAWNLLYYVLDNLFRDKAIDKSQQLMEEVFGKDVVNAKNLEKLIDVFLVNIHPSIDVSEPLLPNVISIGGLQVQQTKPLPQEISQFIESSKKGAVLFSLGSNIKSEILGQERILMFIRAIAKFPDYNFLWKFSNTEKLDLPKNLLLQKWLPQNDILGHPKTVLFMSHGGLLSTHESTWHGVPILGIPFFADQITNIKKSIDAGVAEKLDPFNLTEEAIIAKLSRMLNDRSYKEQMAIRSSLFRDRRSHPLDEAVWWCEYIMRHKGAPHLKSQAKNMGALALFMWDILLFCIGVCMGSITLLYCVVKKIFCQKKSISTSEDLRNKKIS